MTEWTDEVKKEQTREWLENIGPSVKCSDCFEPVNQPEDGEYKRGFIDGWVKCTDYFIKHELNKEDDIYG